MLHRLGRFDGPILREGLEGHMYMGGGVGGLVFGTLIDLHVWRRGVYSGTH